MCIISPQLPLSVQAVPFYMALPNVGGRTKKSNKSINPKNHSPKEYITHTKYNTPMSQLALQLIAEAKRTNAKVLDLGNCDLTELPDELFELTALEELNLCNSYWDYKREKWVESKNHGSLNQLKVLKKGIAKLKAMKTLHINGELGNEIKISDISFLEKLTGLQTLNLSSNKISDFSFLKKLTELQTLNLNSSQISDFSFLKKLTGLQTLKLNVNKISDFSFLKNLMGLQTLDLIYNEISDTSFLKNLTGLQTLDLSYNKISEISFLENLTGLQMLNISFNEISDISFLENLTGLQMLDLSFNQISNFSFLENLTELKILNLSSNQISDISFLENLTGLQILDLSFNEISDISYLQNLIGLQTLELQLNEITNIELSFLNQLQNLSKLSLNRNPLINIENHIIGYDYNNCLTDLRIYLEDLESGKTINNTAKLIFVGNGGVGKTQIARCMVEAEDYVFDSQHRSTHAISLLHKHLPCSFLSQGLDLTLWDFAGQDIYHASHRLFMQTKAIFILVWDKKTEKATHHTYNEKKYKNHELLYWLEYIKHFSDNSPIILLQNKVDHEEVANQKLPAITINAYKEDYNVVRQIQVSAKTGKGFPVLEHTIKNLFKENGVLSSALLKELPNSWVAVREKIYQAVEQDVKTITIEQFEAYCATEEIKKSSNTVLNFFHNTGVLFYRSGYFNNQIIVDQAWAIEAVYKVFDRDSDYFEILTDKEEGKKGQLDYDDICTIWKNNTDDERVLFIDFMLSCELCFESTPNKKKYPPLSERYFVIPQFLPSKPASLNFYFKEYNISREEQWRQYTFLPEVYIHRFIINAHQFAKPHEIWTNGILLYYPPENAYAMVEADYDGACIHIQYSPNCVNLLNAIHKELDKIAQEGKIKPLALTDQDPKAFGKKVIQGFKDLLPNTHIDVNREQPKKIFISYTHKDLSYREKLEIQLKPLLRKKQIKEVWTDHKILAGQDWNAEIEKNLKEADIVFLLISDDFFASDYIYEKELPVVKERYNKKVCAIIPILVRPSSHWGDSDWTFLQAIPSKKGNLTPISKWVDKDDAWKVVTDAIKKIL